MHMTSRKDLNSADLETVTTSRCPTTVIIRMKRLQFSVRELDIFLTEIPEDTLAVVPLGKLCEDHRYSYEWIHGQTMSHLKWCSDTM